MPPASRLAAALLVWTAALVACRADAPQAAHPTLTPWAIDVGEHTGLSDLAIAADGHFWALPERQRALLRLALEGPQPGVDAPEIAIAGVPDGSDTEALAILGPGRFALGLEAAGGDRDSDDVLWLSVVGGTARVTGRTPLPYALWDLRGESNAGIEGLCAVGNTLLAGVETVGIAADGSRFAPIGRLDLTTQTWTPFALPLSSRIGALSALACEGLPGSDDLQAWAIERHIGVSRLLRFRIPREGPGGTLHPQVWLDFGDVLDAVPNLEGITIAPNGDIVVLSDNDFGLVTGPTQAVRIPQQATGRGI